MQEKDGGSVKGGHGSIPSNSGSESHDLSRGLIAAQQSADEAGEEAPLGGAGAAPRGDLNLGKAEVPQRPRRRCQQKRPRGRRPRERATEEEGLDHVAGGRRPPAETERRARKGVRATAMSLSLHSSK